MREQLRKSTKQALVALCVTTAGTGFVFATTPAQGEAPRIQRVSKQKAVKAVSKLGARTAKAKLSKTNKRRLVAASRSALKQTRRGRSCTAVKQLNLYVKRSSKLKGKQRAAVIRLERAAKDAQLLVLRVPRKVPSCTKKPTAKLDNRLRPATAEIPPRADGVRRPVARLAIKGTPAADFVGDEVVVFGAAGRQLDSFLKRWNGKIIATTTLPGGSAKALYLVRVKPGGARVKATELSDDLRRIDPRARGTVAVSDRAGIASLAAAADGAAGGLKVGLNWLGAGDGLLDSITTDTAPLVAANGAQIEGAASSSWSYMRGGGLLDIDVTEAWRALAAANRLTNKVKIGIIDGGFGASDDYAGNPRTTGANGLGCGGGNPCPWHGQNVSHAAAAVPDNGRGSAGPAGPVAEMVHVEYDGGANAVFESVAAVVSAATKGADIINMSWHISVPATVSFTLVPFEATTAAVAAAGTILFASAGNDGSDVDAEDCFLACWEETWHAPCENAGVTCVGGVNNVSGGRSAGSNYGSESCGGPPCTVQMWAPYTVYVGPDAVTPFTHQVSGTSFSAPFAAGVAALVWAANPSLSASKVVQIMHQTAKTSPDIEIRRFLNARQAVRAALGNAPARLEITSPAQGAQIQYGPSSIVSLAAAAADPLDKSCCAVTWTSTLDGSLGSGRAPLLITLPTPGTRTITATINTATGPKSVSVSIEGLNTPPKPQILSPQAGAQLLRGARYDLRGSATDVNEKGNALPCDALSWKVVRLTGAGAPSTEAELTGCSPEHAFAAAATYRLDLTATDGAGAKTTVDRTLSVAQPGPNAPPVAKIESPKNDARLAAGVAHQLVGSAFEPDGNDTVQFVWRVNWAGGSAVIGEGSTISWRPADSGFGGCHGGSPLAGQLVLTAQDDDGADSDIIEFTTDFLIC